MDRTDLDQMSKLSPFELKDTLIKLASRHSERLMLNAGRGNPNFLAAVPRHGFFQLGLFAMSEAERSSSGMPEGVGGLPEPDGIATRFEKFVKARRSVPGVAFLAACVSLARERLEFSDDDLLYELVEGVLGCNYPSPVRMLRHTEEIVRHYLREEMTGECRLAGKIDLFAVEGATAGMTYVFNSLRQNKLIAPGDTVAIGVPIFAPYLEIPQLNNYRLEELAVEADPEAGWQYPDRELDKLLDRKVKAFVLVNPGNPSSVKIDEAGLAKISEIVTAHRRDLIILTDDVYATFANDFVSLFALCPENTILLYSFSKYFGATGWRLGVIALHENNILDAKISALPKSDPRRRALPLARDRSPPRDSSTAWLRTAGVR
jgi:aspartate 4-decarboxylase